MNAVLIVAAVLGPLVGFVAGVLARPGVIRVVRQLVASVRRARIEEATASGMWVFGALGEHRAREARRQRGLP